MTNTRVYWLHTLSPTHVGTGRGVGYIDLPIHRDKVTNWPVIPGSAFKGVWRDWAREGGKKHLDLAFGRASDVETKNSNAGALVPTDARLACLPVRSFQGTFAWCTSPLALQMLCRDLSLAGMKEALAAPSELSDGVLHRPHDKTKLEDGGRIYLEDLDFAGVPCKLASAWAEKIAGWVFPEDAGWQARFRERFAIVPDVTFDFFTETGTEVSARVRIDDDSKTVKVGQLWNEESLPAETILAGLISCDRVYGRTPDGVDAAALIEELATSTLVLQIGGKATVGRGRTRCVFTDVKGEG
jgi:CRISPR-associated protein Cmr4